MRVRRVVAARLAAAQRYARTLVLRRVAAAAVAVVEGGVAAALLAAGSGGLAEVLQHALTLLLLQTDVLPLQVPPVLPHVRVGHPAEFVVSLGSWLVIGGFNDGPADRVVTSRANPIEKLFQSSALFFVVVFVVVVVGGGGGGFRIFVCFVFWGVG